MLSVAIDDDPHVDGSADIRAYRALQTRALADARAGRASRSEHSIYGSTYRHASRIAAIDRGELILSLGYVHDVESGEAGMLVMYGEGASESDAEFRSCSFLRSLGCRVETPEGEDVTPEINPIQ